MYLINVTIHQEKIPENQRAGLFEEHVAWFTKHYENGNFLLVGPYTDKEMTGLSVTAVDRLEEVVAIIADDSYYPDLADYEIRPFKGNMIAPDFATYQRK